MARIDVQDPQARVPDLLARVARGEEVVIVERGKPVAKVVPHPQPKRNYRAFVGCWKGRVDVSGADEADKAIYRALGMLE